MGIEQLGIAITPRVRGQADMTVSKAQFLSSWFPLLGSRGIGSSCQLYSVFQQDCCLLLTNLYNQC
jgi:hypothetical protein